MEFRILGPVEVIDRGQQLPRGGGKQRALLAALLVHANHVVSNDLLIDWLWGERPPDTAQAALHVHVSQLRKVLGAGHVLTEPAGYRIRVPPEDLDAMRFEQWIAVGSGDRSSSLREALALWRGPALGEFNHQPFAEGEAARLEELRLSTLEERIDDDLSLGRHREVIGELEALVRKQPLRERLRGQLMLALYRCGRQAEALASYRDTRDLLVEELGIDPSPALQELERQILKQDPALTAPLHEGGAARAAADLQMPREERKTVSVVFADLVGFTSRTERLDPEDVNALVSPYYLRLRAELERYGGRVEKFVGDAVMALFGAPVAHEDDAERAVRTGLRVLEAVAELNKEAAVLDLAVRIRVNTGEAVVALQARPEEGESMAAGAVV